MRTTYTVTGRWPFPADMLRYDEAQPATPHDAALIERFSNPSESPYLPGSREEREVSITLVSERRAFFLRSNCAHRWRSYGWRSSLDESPQPGPPADASGPMLRRRCVHPSGRGRYRVVEVDGSTQGRLLADGLSAQAAAELAAVPAMLALLSCATAPGGIGAHEFSRPGGWREQALRTMGLACPTE